MEQLILMLISFGVSFLASGIFLLGLHRLIQLWK